MSRRGRKKRKALPWIILGCVVLVLGGVVLGVRAWLFGGEKIDPKDPEIQKIDTTIPDVEREGVVKTFVIGGTDDDGTRTDVLMLGCYDGNKNTATLMNIPRDTCVEINGKHRKINSAYSHGKEEGLLACLEDTLGFKPDYYFVVGLDAFRSIVDLVGGVEVDVPFDMNYDDSSQGLSIHLKKGLQTLNGAQAEGFVRYRKGYADADLGRIRAQQAFMTSLFKKCLSFNNWTKIPQMMQTVLGNKNINTNIGLDDALSLAKMALNLDMENVQMLTAPSEPCSYQGESFVSFYEDEMLEVLNKYFNLYKTPLTSKDTNIIEISKEYANIYGNTEGTSMGEIDENGVVYHKYSGGSSSGKNNGSSSGSSSSGSSGSGSSGGSAEKPEEPSEPSGGQSGGTTDPNGGQTGTEPGNPSGGQPGTDPNQPAEPTEPVEPTEPTEPTTPPADPEPTTPAEPTTPTQPTEPTNPTGPVVTPEEPPAEE